MNEILTDNFLALAAIPRPTFHEEAVSRYLYERALSHGLDARRDSAGNVIVDRGAAPGFENVPRVLMQAHMDMVAVARPGTDWNGETDPVTVIRDGDLLRAEKSSLGGDDGAGIAVIEAIMEDEELRCGALRAIFTVDEEQTMSGANALDESELDGRYLLNLDWEEKGVLCTSSAGSDLMTFDFPYAKSPAEGRAFALSLSGLLGGHSGIDINKGRANAIRVLSTVLFTLMEEGMALRLGSFEAGIASNAIPTRADALVYVTEEDTERFFERFDALCAAETERYAAVEEQMVFSVLETEERSSAIGAEESLSLCRFLKTSPIGVFGVIPPEETVVESSANLSEVHFTKKGVRAEVLQRSCVKSYLSKMRTEYNYRAYRAGGDMHHRETHAPWPGKDESPLAERFRAAYRDMTGEELRVTPVHAGLECGVWARKNPELEMISIGMDAKNIHTFEETLELGSVELLHDMVVRVIKEIAEE